VLVVFWTAFPVAFGSVMSTLTIPFFLAAIGIIFRGAAFAVRGEAATIAEARALGATFALSSVLIPFFLGAALGGIASGRVPIGNASGDLVDSWFNPTSVVVGAIAVATGAHLAAVYLAGDAVRAGLPDIVRAFRARALASGAVAGAIALGGLVVVRDDARGLYDGLTSGGGLAMVVVSGVAGSATLALVWRERYGWARVSAAGAVAAIVVGWALAQEPYLLPGQVTVDAAAAGHSTLVALVISMGAGALVLAPSLWLLYSSFLKGRLDSEFHPLAAGDDRPEG
jgi:cytochrome d ubiquinol oxidase subunit II